MSFLDLFCCFDWKFLSIHSSNLWMTHMPLAFVLPTSRRANLLSPLDIDSQPSVNEVLSKSNIS